MKNFIKKIIIASPVVFVPFAAYAAAAGSYCDGFSSSTPLKDLTTFIKTITCFLLNTVVQLIFALSIVIFMWGLFKFMSSEGTTEREQGRQFMLWGVIALAVMFSVWGVVALLGNTFHVQNVIPTLPVTPPSIQSNP